MKIESDIYLDFSDVLIRPKRSTLTSRKEIILTRDFKFPYAKNSWAGIPIIISNMDTTGTFEIYEVASKETILTCLHKHYTPQNFIDYGLNKLNPALYMISTGISDKDFDKLNEIISLTNCNWICIDIANGYVSNLITFCKKVRDTWPEKIIIAGNVATREMTEELIINGKVDIVKVGIGPGSACLTRQKTGIGLPQLSAIIECADAAHGLHGYIIGDGGITCPGDMAKAFGGGADFTMAGGIFAGHTENPGDIIKENGKEYKLFYGMSSKMAMEKYSGEMANYRSSEGREVRIPYKGDLINTIEDYLGGLRSACTYINAKCIKYIPKCTTFIRVNNQLNNKFAT